MKNKNITSTKKIKMICTQGSKGGVGKTFLAAQIASWLKARGVVFKAYDLDTENSKEGGLHHFIPDAIKIDIHTREGLDILLDASQGEHQVVLVDMPAATGYLLFEWFADMYETCRDLGIEFVFVCIVTPDASTVTNTLNWAHVLGHKVQYVVATNPKEDAHAEFEFWNNSVEADEFREKFNPAEIALPSIRSDVMPHLAEAGITLHDATEVPGKLPAKLDKFSVQVRIKSWRDKIFAQLDTIAKELCQ